MDFDIARAVLGGLAGTAAMTMLMCLGGSMMGIKMDMPMILGTMFLSKGTAAWMVGMMMHLMMGIVFFLIYGLLIAGFEIHSAIAGWSALFGSVHALIAGTAFGIMPVLHPRMATEPASDSDTVPTPGFMGLQLGRMAPMAIIGTHVVYGVVGGAIYAI